MPNSRAQHLPALTVSDVMVRHPKTLPATASVHDALAAFQDDHVHLLLLVEGATLVGTVTRDDLPGVTVDARVVDSATLVRRTVSARTAAADAMARMRAGSSRRLAVVDDDLRLLGLLCLKRTGRGFCSDEDVASRRAVG